MKKSILTLLLLLTTYAGFSQYLVWTPETQTVSGASGDMITAKVTVSCQGTQGQYASYFLSPCDDDGSFYSINWQNGNVYVGSPIEITFKFRSQGSSSSSSYTYTFKKDFGNCEDTDKISITVNYGPASCSYNPTMFSGTSTSNSITVNFTKDSNVRTYYLYIKRNDETDWDLEVISRSECGFSSCSYTYVDLLPSTTYNFKLKTQCTNNAYSDWIYMNKATTPCYVLPAATNITATPYMNQGYLINFSPPGGYLMEYIDLDTGAAGNTTISHSTTPGNGNVFYFSQNNSFKFRLKNSDSPCSLFSEWYVYNQPITCTANVNTSSFALYDCSSGCGVLHFTKPANTTNYQVEYILFNMSGQTITGTLTGTSNNPYITPGISIDTGLWLIKFRVRAQCTAGSWGNYSDWSGNFAW